jgi:hypothetical protein
MNTNLLENLQAVCQILNEHAVEYLTIGGAAVTLPRFREVFAAKETTKLDDVEIPFVSYEHLIMNKQALGRPKDQEDIRQLELKKKQDQQPPQPRLRQRRR